MFAGSSDKAIVFMGCNINVSLSCLVQIIACLQKNTNFIMIFITKINGLVFVDVIKTLQTTLHQISVYSLSLFSGILRKGMSAASDEPQSADDSLSAKGEAVPAPPTNTRLILSGGEGYVDFRLGESQYSLQGTCSHFFLSLLVLSITSEILQGLCPLK